MTALAANYARPSRKLGKTHLVPVNGGSRIYQGAAVMIDPDGFARPAAALASNRGCWGCATKEADNTSGADGAIYVVVQEGEYLFAADTLEQNDVGARAYADDDNTADETQAANAPQLGLVGEYVSATSGWIEMSRTNAVA
jgi:hypothetical protein